MTATFESVPVFASERFPGPGKKREVQKMKRAIAICGSMVITVFLAGTAAVDAQTTASAPAAAPATNGNTNWTPPFKKEELEAIVAPIALYPDALLAQIFMASTYPLEVLEAARWSKE